MKDTNIPSDLDGEDERDRLAAEWCARLHGDHASGIRSQFEVWLRADPRNRQAYNQMEEIYLLGAMLRASPPVEQEPPLRGGARAGQLVSAIIVVSLLVSVLAYLRVAAFHLPAVEFPDGPDSASTESNHEAFTSSEKEIYRRLPDGSELTLYAHSRLETSYSKAARSLKLIAGSARFQVAHEARPFMVYAGGGRVVATGTVFQVSLTPERGVLVTLTEGTVRVKAPITSKFRSEPTIRTMNSGEKFTFVALPITSSDGSSLSGGETVGELVERVNYMNPRATQISLENADIANLRVSGVFDLHNPATLADRLCTVLDLICDQSSGGILLRRAD